MERPGAQADHDAAPRWCWLARSQVSEAQTTRIRPARTTRRVGWRRAMWLSQPGLSSLIGVRQLGHSEVGGMSVSGVEEEDEDESGNIAEQLKQDVCELRVHSASRGVSAWAPFILCPGPA